MSKISTQDGQRYENVWRFVTDHTCGGFFWQKSQSEAPGFFLRNRTKTVLLGKDVSKALLERQTQMWEMGVSHMRLERKELSKIKQRK